MRTWGAARDEQATDADLERVLTAICLSMSLSMRQLDRPSFFLAHTSSL